MRAGGRRQVSVALQLNAIFDFNQQSQQLRADFMLISNWTDLRYGSHPDAVVGA